MIKLEQFLTMRIKGRHWFVIIFRDDKGNRYSINSKTKVIKFRRATHSDKPPGIPKVIQPSVN